ncbi:multicopper oxidase type 2 (plasmid) [Paracoccus aminophilus JCM 7686]|uniref:Multicopper oxidase type 2 n=2 Tax=Paracoccus aminophilus TaxID=34003 RepID=S5Y607_PARAH|nr:multicopper oxidase type 2 [Paracoccus aminophilus JCM 7686]
MKEFPMSFTRRGALAATAAFALLPAMPRLVRAETTPMTLRTTTRVIEVAGKAATVFGIENAQGGAGLILDPGQRFHVDLRNEAGVSTLIHWHGQIPPNLQDGVPDAPLAALNPGESRSYDFEPAPGTHWMHAHIPVQEIAMMAAPLIVRRPEDLRADRQEVVMFLHDFTFRTPEDMLAEIQSGHGGPAHAGTSAAPAMGAMSGMDHSAHGTAPAPSAPAPSGPASSAHDGHDMSGMAMPGMAMSGHDMSAMSGMDMGAMDLNDFDFDAYLVNDRTLDDPEIIRVETGGRVLLRVINAASATTFWIDSAALPMRLVAVDGQPVQPLAGQRFGLSMGQRLDLEIDLPGAGAWPILALREGAREQSGLVLATAGAPVAKLPLLAENPAPAFDTDLAQESRLRAVSGLAPIEGIAPRMVMLGGSMQPYRWTIDDRTWQDRAPIAATSGERMEIMFHNMSMMGHPMHLHGHHFQIVGINGQRFAGALRDTVYVPPMSSVTLAINPGEAARWMLHCHHMPHLETGMMTEFVVSA